MRHLDLFSGVGGISLAAHWAGMQTAAFCEIEPYPQQVLRKHWPDVPIIPDVHDVTRKELTKLGVGAIDLISIGDPCQPYSVAGKRGGEEDDRYLWPQARRVLEEIRPRWIVRENVPGNITMGLDGVLDEMEALDYAAWPIVFPAAAVGASHKRDRLFVVGYTKRGGLGGEPWRGTRPESANGYCGMEGGSMADTSSSRCDGGIGERGGKVRDETRREEPERRGNALAYSAGAGLQEQSESNRAECREKSRTRMDNRFKRCGEAMADSKSIGFGNGHDGADKRTTDRKIDTLADASPFADKTMADTSGAGCQECDTSTIADRPGYGSRRGNGGGGQNGQLNPAWVEHLMNFPPGWTEV